MRVLPPSGSPVSSPSGSEDAPQNLQSQSRSPTPPGAETLHLEGKALKFHKLKRKDEIAASFLTSSGIVWCNGVVIEVDVSNRRVKCDFGRIHNYGNGPKTDDDWVEWDEEWCLGHLSQAELKRRNGN